MQVGERVAVLETRIGTHERRLAALEPLVDKLTNEHQAADAAKAALAATEAQRHSRNSARIVRVLTVAAIISPIAEKALHLG